MIEVTMSELEAQRVEMLPARETLFSFNFANVWASNSSVALNLLTANSAATSAAVQNIAVLQH
ncbi:hypothetical protein ACFQ36_13920 [Arthrobacter sp. GCM10027362]|uniref:hypothetical protein n=1 Tax=Arthrobacter sp. GCM10027362 TaxID=3273379 RepID=UPI00363B1E11